MAVWTLIAHDSLSLPAATVAWSSIPASYDHLYIVASERNSNSALGTAPLLRVGNGSIDSGANYSRTVLYWRIPDSLPSSTRGTGDSSIQMLYGNNNSNVAGAFSGISVWIPHYASGYYKSMLVNIANVDESTSNYTQGQGLHAGLWQNTAAITDISITADGGGGGDQHMAYSTFDLYGITGA